MNITCQRCGNKAAQKYGKDIFGAQRFKCIKCGRVQKRHSPKNKVHNQEIWFNWWIKEGLSVRKISRISGYSPFKIKQIKNYWLKQERQGFKG
jgi:transposase-like protein